MKEVFCEYGERREIVNVLFLFLFFRLSFDRVCLCVCVRTRVYAMFKVSRGVGRCRVNSIVWCIRHKMKLFDRRPKRFVNASHYFGTSTDWSMISFVGRTWTCLDFSLCMRWSAADWTLTGYTFCVMGIMRISTQLLMHTMERVCLGYRSTKIFFGWAYLFP